MSGDRILSKWEILRESLNNFSVYIKNMHSNKMINLKDMDWSIEYFPNPNPGAKSQM